MMMKFYILAVLFIAAQAKEFDVKDATNKTCAMLTLDGQVNLAAESTNGTVNKTLKIDDATLIADSNCTLIKLNMTSSAQVWFQFEDQDSNWRVTPIAAFVPEEVFGSAFNDTALRTFVADPLHAFTKNESYACTATITKPFKETSEPSKQYNYTVSAETSNFQIQSLDSGKFAEAEHCSEDKPTTSTTTPTTPTTSTKTSPTSATTVTPTPPAQNATCTSGGITRIRMAGEFALSITYNATEKGKDVQRTVYIPVPPNADTTGSKCDNSSATEEVLSLGFFNGWLIEYTFDTASSDLAVGAGSGDYYVSSINITYKYDEHLPGAKDNGTVLKSHSFEGSNFLKATSDGYFSCKANVTTAIVKNEVSLITKDLKYKAFNNKGDAEFKGDVSECDQDEDTSSVVPIAVGAALAGLVVIVLISYLIGRKRSRKSGYESV